jgi:hypothetical protein
MKAVAASGDEGMIKLFLATHTGMTEEQFEETASAWLATAEQPRFHRLYTQCVYQPMLKLLAYLRANRFKTYIVSGGGQDFMRPFTQKVYGVPPEQVVGTQFKSQYMLKSIARQSNFCRGFCQSMTDRESRKRFSASSGRSPSPHSGIPTATSRCSNGLGRTPAPISNCSSITRTP